MDVATAVPFNGTVNGVLNKWRDFCYPNVDLVVVFGMFIHIIRRVIEEITAPLDSHLNKCPCVGAGVFCY